MDGTYTHESKELASRWNELGKVFGCEESPSRDGKECIELEVAWAQRSIGHIEGRVEGLG